MSTSAFVWYDVMTTDTKAAQAFYRAVIGWDMTDSGMTDREYVILSKNGAQIGGLMPIPPDAKAMGVKPAWMGYIGVDDVDAYAKRVTAAGGMVHKPPTDIPGVGRFAVVGDPHGAGFMLFQGASGQAAPPPAPGGTLGHIGWHELHAGDGASAFAFYAGLFGWTKGDAMDMGPMGVYQLFKSGAADDAGGIMTKMPETPMPMWLYYFNVDAVDAAIARIKANGGQLVNDPMEVPGGMWIAQALDPQGAMFAVLAPKR
jgi:predicted enzyme related to lactoylglutathione lyase